MSFLQQLSNLFELHSDKASEEDVVLSIKSSSVFRGTNLWLLVFAIFVASIGLNINSTAVIIGAMLISPLMGPIVGAGMALAINDFALLKKALSNLLVATLIAMTVSTIYFFITPLRDAQSELLARTSPNIFDVLIALFGGLAGIVGVSRKEKSNVIPGVAIATALMPPLCTAGYGIATAQLQYMLGAFYLYLINCTFICIATFLMVKYLRFQPVQYVDKQQAIRIRSIMSTAVAIMVLPAIFFAWQVVQENKFRKKANRFVEEQFIAKEHIVLSKKINAGVPASIELIVLDKKFSQAELDTLQQLVKTNYGMPNTRLLIRQDQHKLTKSDFLNFVEQQYANEVRLETVESALNQLEKSNTTDAGQLLQELQQIDSSIVQLQAGWMINALQDSVFQVGLQYNGTVPRNNTAIVDYLKVRMKGKQVVVNQ
ncbi:MAG: TIGR00341 family protein [Chitinophagaceae bacterium]|nr:TIGR00341 family protein [Chitinophagaceae bacterium]